MQSISTYHEALRAIWDRSGYDRGFISNPFAGDTAARLGLRRTRLLLEKSGHPQLPYAIVHVAGSKGKGSTSTMVDAVLRAANLRTGRYLSPHMHSFRERFVVNDSLISEEGFILLTRRFITLAEEVERIEPDLGRITAFELTTAMALAWFAQQQCEVAVIEVGMGGELDSTNVVTPTVSVITTLDFEHTAILGSTMAEIAANKAGIIKQSRPVLSAAQPPDALDVVTERAAARNAPLLLADRDWRVQGSSSNFRFTRNHQNFSRLACSLVGQHQMENAGLAIATALTLSEVEPSLLIDEAAIRAGIASATLPARFEQVQLPSGQTLIIDGAHTPASTAALAAAVHERFPDAITALVIGMLADKELEASLAPLQRMTSRWIAVPPASPRAVPADELQVAIAALGHQAVTATSVHDGIRIAKDSDAEVIVVTGSFSTASEARVSLHLPTVVDPPMDTT